MVPEYCRAHARVQRATPTDNDLPEIALKNLPAHLSCYKRTPQFNETTVPAGLLKAHTTKQNTWAKIVIVEGELLYTILAPEVEKSVLSKDRFGVIEPGVPHQVQPLGGVKFWVEFYR